MSTAVGGKGRIRATGNAAASSMKWDSPRKASTLNATGRRPLPEPMTVAESLIMVVLHVCRKAVIKDPKFKIGIYFAFLFIASTLTDIGLPIPKTYFSDSKNALNQYFVKLGWGWTVTFTSIYIYLTSSVYCAGDRRQVIQHMLRMVVGTMVWYLCTNLFVYVEGRTGACTQPKITSRISCLRKGHRWIGFDISGHCFLLIFCHLLIADELRTLINWDRIGDIIRNEPFDEDSPIKDLTDEQKSALRHNYKTYTPYIRAVFIFLSFLAILWDGMLVVTALYFHSMVQKVAGGVFGAAAWFFVYKVWYPRSMIPPPPGVGLFKYSERYRRA